MPVQRFRSVESMPDTGSLPPGSPQIPTVLAQVLEFNAKLSPLRPPRGVHRFKTTEELNQHRASWAP